MAYFYDMIMSFWHIIHKTTVPFCHKYCGVDIQVRTLFPKKLPQYYFKRSPAVRRVF